MNISELKNKSIVYFSILLLSISSCSKKEVKQVYQVQEVHVEQPGADKQSVKSSTEYISIAYSDIFGKAIPNSLLQELTKTYIAFGDVSVVEDLIIRNFLKDENANIPTNSEMRANTSDFVKNTFKQLYSRNPNEQEVWYFSKIITEDQSVTPDVIYYALLTSNEYRQF